MDPILMLIPSALLGPATWALTGEVLDRLGRRVRVANLRAVAQGEPPYWPVGVDAIVEAADGDLIILVPHSNAGLYVPPVVAALGEQVRGVVFVDAALPSAGPYAQRDFLSGIVDIDGLLPPWTTWWAEPDVAGLFPNDEVRARVETEQARLPLAYYDHLPPDVEGWDRPPRAYIWFTEPYDKVAERAAANGWPTKNIPGRHLHMLIDPDAVAAGVLEMASDWR